MPPVQVSGQVCLFSLVLGKAAVSAEKSRAHYLSHMDNACFTKKITGNSSVPLLHKIYITSLSSRDPLNAEFSNLIFKFIIHRNTTKPMLPPPAPNYISWLLATAEEPKPQIKQLLGHVWIMTPLTSSFTEASAFEAAKVRVKVS